MAICNDTGYSVSQSFNFCTTSPVGIPGFFQTILQCWSQAGVFCNSQQLVGEQPWDGIQVANFPVPAAILNAQYQSVCAIASLLVSVIPLAGVQATAQVKAVIDTCNSGSLPYNMCGGAGPHEINLVEIVTFDKPACNPSLEA